MDKIVKVLVVFANPRGTSQLNLGREDRIIREAVQLSRNRDSISIDIIHAATIHDLRRALLSKNYDIVHVSGHGTGSGLVLEDESGGKYVVPQQGLASLFGAYAKPSGSLECVILNACYSISQGTLVSLSTPFTIAMEGAISDDAAIEFSRGFYDAVGADKGVAFSYEEGCRNVALSAPTSRFVSKILTLGQTSDPRDTADVEAQQQASTRELFKEKADKSLIGIAVDVSGSMAESIKNDSNRQISRLQSFNESLNRLAKQAKETIQENRSRQIDTTVEVFAYAFGLRSGGVCDLLSLMKVGKDIISEREIEEMKQRHISEMKSKYESYSGLGSLAKQFGFGDIARTAENMVRQSAEGEIKRKIMLEIKYRIEKSLAAVGDTTLSINEVATLSENNSDTLSNSEEFIFGDTPMYEAFSQIHKRFERELLKRSKNTIPILFVVSDGAPSDGNPLPLATEIKKLGVTIITCFVTNRDISFPKILIGKDDDKWDSATKLMFDMASIIDETTSFSDFLLKKGWTIQKEAKLFIQVNHSSVLEEFINVVLSPFDSRGTETLPMGS
jgi:soluble P-type ATPase